MDKLTPEEQQQVDQACIDLLPKGRVYAFNIGWKDGFNDGIDYALQHLLPSRMKWLLEWVSLKGLYQEIDGKWYDKFGGKVRLVAETTVDLFPFYEKYQERLKQKEDGK